ncbi:MAG: ABC transporter permease subunit [Eubacteriales bacterium]|nr:ABC transporter permease subunit [Eubacteriales bacterium]
MIADGKKRARLYLPKKWTLFLMALPFVIYIIMFCYVPLAGWILAFFDYVPGIPLAQTEFVGLKYFKMAFSQSDDIVRVLKNTMAMYLLGLLFSPIPVIYAILLNEIRNGKFKRFTQTTVTFPNFISWIIVASIASSFFSTDGQINMLLRIFNNNAAMVNVLGNEDIVWIFQALLGVWKSFGWNSIIYMAALAGIDESIYEAARIDGAGRLGCALYITVPGLMPTFLIMTLLSISNFLSVGFDQYFVFNNYLVADKIEVLDLYVYRLGIKLNCYSLATTIGILKSILSITLLFSVNRIVKKVRGEALV